MTDWIWFAVCVSFFAVPALAGKGSSRDVRIMNEAGFKVEIFWINRWRNDELVLNSQEGIFHGAQTLIKSYLTHEFEIHEVPAKKTGLCRGETNECRKGYFQVTAHEGQMVTFMTNLTTIRHTDNESNARDQAAKLLEGCRANHLTAGTTATMDDMERLLTCIDHSINASLTTQEEEISFQESVRLKLGSQLVHYACEDPKVKQSTEIENRTWFYVPKKQTLQVKVMMDRPSVQVHLILDFISEEECAAMETATTLERTNGTNGLWASKGGIDIPWNTPDSTVLSLASKFYTYAKDQIKVIALNGENAEQMFVLKYSGKGANASSHDRYDPHCDGVCNGAYHKMGDRIATIMAYCNIPLLGGGTHFNNAGIHIVPQKGSAVYYSYIDPVTQLADTGFTQIAECPVVEGNKTMVTHSIRY